MKLKYISLIVPAITVFVMSGCNLFSTTQEGPCEGSLTLENPIPDTTVAVGDTVAIDLTNPPVFKSTKNDISYSFSGLQGITRIRLNLVDNPNDNNKNSLLLIRGISKGDVRIELIALSECLENTTTINITVTAQ